MDDALLVRRFESHGDPLRDRQRNVERNRAACDPLSEILACEVWQKEWVPPRRRNGPEAALIMSASLCDVVRAGFVRERTGGWRRERDSNPR
jgi:hypothetical protein